jgi:hypothetical protein
VTGATHGTRIVRATAVDAGFRTDSPVNIDLSVPIWTIEHVAAAFHLSVDAAREYTYREDFPRPRTGFSRNLWTRQEVLDWLAGLAPKPRGRHRRPHRFPPADKMRAQAGTRNTVTQNTSALRASLLWGQQNGYFTVAQAELPASDHRPAGRAGEQLPRLLHVATGGRRSASSPQRSTDPIVSASRACVVEVTQAGSGSLGRGVLAGATCEGGPAAARRAAAGVVGELDLTIALALAGSGIRLVGDALLREFVRSGLTRVSRRKTSCSPAAFAGRSPVPP